jgi:hypothetical protein
MKCWGGGQFEIGGPLSEGENGQPHQHEQYSREDHDLDLIGHTDGNAPGSDEGPPLDRV